LRRGERGSGLRAQGSGLRVKQGRGKAGARKSRFEVRGARKGKTGSGFRAQGSGKEGRQERGARNWNCYKATSGSVNWDLGTVEAIRRRDSGS